MPFFLCLHQLQCHTSQWQGRAGHGAKALLLGTTRRSAGKLQATYGGRPLYYYDGDKAPGIVLCQNVPEFGGTWLVLRGSGKLVR